MASIYCENLEVFTNAGTDVVNVTSQLGAIVKKTGVASGCLQATVIGSTGSLTTIEYEPGVVADLKRAIDRLAPPGADYAHEKAWRDGNGHSHVQAALLGPSIVIPIRNGSLALGTWQQVVTINHDNRARKRRIEITIIGNS